MALAPSQPATLYAELPSSGVLPPFGVYKSTNSGDSWTTLTQFYMCGSATDLLVHPTNPGIVIALNDFG